MKRLVLLTLILIPSAFHAIGSMSGACKPPVAIGPRAGRAHGEALRLVSDGASPTASGRIVRNLPSATPERAREDAWQALRSVVRDWLAPAGVPSHWSPKDELLRAMVHAGPIEVVEKDYGTIYIQPLTLDTSTTNRDRLLEAYERDLAGHRLARLAGVLAFVLTCLAAVAGYIHADEATRGYYTNTLRVSAVAAVAAVGAALVFTLA